LNDWIYCTLYIYKVRDYRRYNTIFILHTLQFTVAHALGFPVFNSRILAKDLSQFHCNFKSHMKSPLHGLTPFLPFFLNHLLLPSPELDPIQILAAWDPRYIASRRTQTKHRLHHILYCCVTSPSTRMLLLAHSNGYTRHVSWHILYCCVWVLIAAGICLSGPYLPMDIHVTILFSKPTSIVRFMQCWRTLSVASPWRQILKR
jgi:hypothetical protein